MKRLPPERLGSLVDDKVRTAVEYFAERVAHDFNNIITPILAYPDMLMSLLPDEKCVSIIRSMQESAERAMEVTKLLAALAGGGMAPPKRFDMSELTAEAIAAISQQIEGSDHIMIKQSLDKDLFVTIQPEVFVRALEVVLENAIRAVNLSPAGGSVSIEACSKRIAGLVGVGGEHIPEGSYQILSITDTGPGMSAEDLKHIIEPFVSGFLDRPGCGAGLGLSVAYCGLRRNGAYLQITSSPNVGTSVVMYFPVIAAADSDQPVAGEALQQKAPVIEASPPRQASPVPEGNAAAEPANGPRLLVVDDEPTIANLFKMILENFIPDVTVECAENGAEALDKFKQEHYPVVVMDLHMPIMDGQSAFFEIENYCKKAAVDMPAVIFCTGYAPQAPLRKAVEAQKRHVMLNKPVQSDMLVQAVKERLKAASAR